MSNNIDNEKRGRPEAVDEVLAHAVRRQPAPDLARARAFSRLHSHWQRNTRGKRRIRKTLPWALAASVILSVMLIINLGGELGSPELESQVAKLERVSGKSVFLVADDGALIDAGSMTDFASGSKIQTGKASRIALAWGNGGSLRLDESSKVALLSPTTIRLDAGAVYYDSLDSATQTLADSGSLSVITRYGEVTHVGTQFSTRLLSDSMTVGVREGQVEVANIDMSIILDKDVKGLFDERGKISEEVLPAYDQSWQWVEDIAPHFAANGKSLDELLTWIGRETGRKLIYVSQDAGEQARSQKIAGLENVSPEQALSAISYITGLQTIESTSRIEVRPAD